MEMAEADNMMVPTKAPKIVELFSVLNPKLGGLKIWSNLLMGMKDDGAMVAFSLMLGGWTPATKEFIQMLFSNQLLFWPKGILYSIDACVKLDSNAVLHEVGANEDDQM